MTFTLNGLRTDHNKIIERIRKEKMSEDNETKTETTEDISLKQDEDSVKMDCNEEREDAPKRVILPDDVNMQEGQFLTLWEDQEKYIDHLESKLADLESKEDKKINDASKREHLLVCRLAIKEQEIQELSNQVAELKAAQAPSMASLRNALLDPAVNIIIQNLKKELEAAKKKMQETQEELSAWKFTPDSVTGKRLMSKCRQLLQENEDLGKMISSGRLAKLESELAMQKALCEEMKKNQVDMDDFVQELDEDVEGMQSTIYFLQQQLKEAKENNSALEAKLSEAKKRTLENEETMVDEKPSKRAKIDEETEAGSVAN